MKIASLFVICATCVHTTLAQVTCDRLGTFSPTGPFVGWPNPTCPEDPDMQLVFTMYNTNDGTVGVVFDRDSVPPSFVDHWRTMFIISDWEHFDYASWVEELVAAVVGNRNMNVVTVHWRGTKGSQTEDSWLAASTTRTVGAEAAEVMHTLVTTGGGVSTRMWCVGHGMGAHACGHMGRWAWDVNDREFLERITGLDPYGPIFAANPDRDVGLERTNADFVDVIHTDYYYGSTPESTEPELELGDQDWYVNNGRDQPGCTDQTTCSHKRAYGIFIDTVTNYCYEAERECRQSNDIPGSCYICLTCPTMGYDAVDVEGGLFSVPAPYVIPPYATCG